MNYQSNKRISCIIPTSNRPQLALRAVDSVLAQTFQVFEIIVIDDCSIDPFTLPEDIKYQKVKVIRSDIKLGGARARNLGMKHISGDFFCFLDDDDEYLVDKFENLIQLFDSDPTLDVAVGDTKIFDIAMKMYIKQHPDTILKRDSNTYRNKVHTNSTLISSKLIGQIYFLEDLEKFQDTQFNTELIYKFNFAYTNKFVSIWYTSWSNNQITSKKNVLFNFKNKVRVLAYFIKELKIPFTLLRAHYFEVIKYLITLR